MFTSPHPISHSTFSNVASLKPWSAWTTILLSLNALPLTQRHFNKEKHIGIQGQTCCTAAFLVVLPTKILFDILENYLLFLPSSRWHDSYVCETQTRILGGEREKGYNMEYRSPSWESNCGHCSYVVCTLTIRWPGLVCWSRTQTKMQFVELWSATITWGTTIHRSG